MIVPGRFLAKFWSFVGVLAGAAGLLIGSAVIVISIEHGKAFSDAARGAAEGLSGAERFVKAVTGDVDASSSVLSGTAGVARTTSDAVDDTREILESTGAALADLVGASRSAAGDLDRLSSLALLAGAGAGVFTETGRDLRSAADAGEQALEGIERLSGRLQEVSLAVDSVAASLDSLLSGLQRTSGALEEAGAGIESMRTLSERIAGGNAASVAGIVAGTLLAFLGFQQVFISAGFARLNANSRRDG